MNIGSVRLALLAALLTACAPPAAPEEQGMIATGPDSVAYRLVGTGRDTVVFLSGGPMLGSRYLRDAATDIAGDHALLFLDLRGRGAAPPVRSVERLSLETDVNDLETVRAHFRLDSLRVVAHHWGTAVLLKYHLRYPGRVARAALISPFYSSGQVAFELSRVPRDTAFLATHMTARAAGLDTSDPRTYCERFWGLSFSPIEVSDRRVIRKLAPAICEAPVERLRARETEQRQMYLTFGSWDWNDSIPRLDMPVLVVQGAGDKYQRIAAEQWAERLAHGRLLLTGDTALFPWLEAPASFTRALVTFLDGGWPADAAPLHHHLVTTP